MNPLQIAAWGIHGVSITIPMRHREIEQVLESLGFVYVETDFRFHRGAWRREQKITMEELNQLLDVCPHYTHIGGIDGHRQLPLVDYSQVINPELFPIAKSYQPIISAFETSASKVAHIPADIQRMLGVYHTRGVYDDDWRVHIVQNFSRFRQACRTAWQKYATRNGKVVQFPLQEGIREALVNSFSINHARGLYYTPSPESVQLHALIALLETHSDVLFEDGIATIVYPAWPAESPVNAVTLKTAKTVGSVASWVILPSQYASESQMVHISFVGTTQTVRAMWASVLGNGGRSRDFLQITDPMTYSPRICQRHPGKYEVFTNDVMLPTSGIIHLIMDSHDLIHNPTPNQPFVHISGGGFAPQPELDVFINQLNKALILGFDPAWSAKLWEYGLELKAIISIPAHGVSAWLVRAEKSNLWGRIIAALTTGKTLKEVEKIELDTYGALYTATDEEDIEEADDYGEA